MPHRRERYLKTSAAHLQPEVQGVFAVLKLPLQHDLLGVLQLLNAGQTDRLQDLLIIKGMRRERGIYQCKDQIILRLLAVGDISSQDWVL